MVLVQCTPSVLLLVTNHRSIITKNCRSTSVLAFYHLCIPSFDSKASSLPSFNGAAVATATRTALHKRLPEPCKEANYEEP